MPTTLVPLLLLLPFLLAGVVRVWTGAPLGVGLALGMVVAGGLGAWARRRLDRRLAPWLAATAMSALAFAVLYAVPFDGLVTVGGGDAGQHVRLAHAFAHGFPGAYHGFAGFFALTQGLEGLFGLDSFQSFRAGYYCVPIAFALIAASLHGGGRRGWAVSLAAFALVGWRVFFPLLHYHQADGYYPHLFALIVLWATVALYAQLESPVARVALWLPAVAFYRHTYGLNLGDFCLAAAVLISLEAVRAKKWPWLAAAALALGAAGYAFVQLSALIGHPGDIVYPTLHQVLRGEAFLVLAALMASRLPSLPAPHARFLTAVAAFGVSNSLVQMGWRAASMPNEYYFLKYHLHGVMLVVLALVAVLFPALARLLLRKQWRWAAALAVPLAIGLFNLDRGYEAYRAPFGERVAARPPFHHIGPLADRDGWKAIGAVLAQEHATFGGLAHPSWPLMNFMNAAFEAPEEATLEDPGWTEFVTGGLREGPGRCVFWYVADGYRPEVAAALKGREGTCTEHPARWDPDERLRLCHACRPR